MTDDRAKRLRELRNRTGRSRDESESPDPSESTDAEARDSTDVDGSEVDATKSTESNDESPDSLVEPDEPSSNSSDATDATERESTSSAANEPTERTRTEPSERARAEPAEHVQAGSPERSPATPAENERAGAPESAPADERSPPAGETTSVSYDESETAEPPGSAPQRGDTQGVDPALQGAIADTSVMASAIETIGEEPTVDSSAILEDAQTHGQTIGRESAVFEQGNTLLHSAHDGENTVQMLEFYLNDSRYAVEIDRISAIVEMKDITRFPRGPEAIDGVTDLRGEITGVLDPTVMLSVERNELSNDQYIVVLKRSDDKQKLGIRVSDVSQAVTYRESQIDETGAVLDVTNERQHEFVKGIVKKTTDERTSLVTWLDIDAVIEHAND